GRFSDNTPARYSGLRPWRSVHTSGRRESCPVARWPSRAGRPEHAYAPTSIARGLSRRSGGPRPAMEILEAGRFRSSDLVVQPVGIGIIQAHIRTLSV